MADPLGRLLCEVLDVPSPVIAVTQLISMTFDGLGYSGARLAELITKSDIEATYSRAGVASEMGLSLRQFFRYRARAIHLLSEQIKHVLSDSGSVPNPLHTLAELVGETSPDTAIAIYDLMEGSHDNEQLITRMSSEVDRGGVIPDAWVNECPEPWRPLCTVLQARCYELNGDSDAAQHRIALVRAQIAPDHPLKARIESEIRMVEVLRAKHRHNAADIHRLGQELRGIAVDDREKLTRALLIEGEGCVRLGILSEAKEIMRYVHRLARTNRDVRSMALLTLLFANVALMTGELAEADELATGAFFALQEQRPDAALCQMTVARARLPIGKKWSMLPDFVMRSERAWDRLGLEIIEARYLLRDAKFDIARETAARILEQSLASEFLGLAAHAAATIAACEGVRGEDAAEQKRYLQAWTLIAGIGDRLAACDVFTMPVLRPKDLGPMVVDEDLCDAISSRALIISKSAAACMDRSSSRRMNALWKGAIEFSGGTSALRVDLQAAAADLGFSGAELGILGQDLAITLPHERRERWLQRWNELFTAIQPNRSLPHIGQAS
jgi:hypothetical protein